MASKRSRRSPKASDVEPAEPLDVSLEDMLAEDDAGAETVAREGAQESAKDGPARGRQGSRGGAGSKGGKASKAARGADSATSAKSARSAARDEVERTGGRRVAAEAPNPPWLVPTAVTLLILGLVYLVVYYISSGMLPLGIGDWNLAVGFGLLMAGGGMLMFWK